jgi:peptidoglycan hydrolase CwlO-like protein
MDTIKKAEYGDRILKQFQKDPNQLGSHERRLARKYYEAKNEADKLDREIRQVNQQISQGKARINSLSLQWNELTGKAAAFLEYILDLKFDSDEESIEKNTATDADPAGNGKAPTKPRRKKKSTKAKQGARA